jgi:hypothetical protein
LAHRHQLVEVTEEDLELFAREYINHLGEQPTPTAESMIVPVRVNDESEYDLTRGAIINELNLQIGTQLNKPQL